MIKRILLHTVLFIILFFVVALLFLTTTTSGLKVSVFLIDQFASKTLSIQKVDGKLINHVKITGLRFKNQQIDLSINDVELHWRAFFLLSKKLHISELSISGVKLNLLNTAAKPSPTENSNISFQDTLRKKLPLFTLPISISANNINLQNIVIHQKGTHKNTHIEYIRFTIHAKRQAVDIKNLELSIFPYTLNLTGQLQFNWPYISHMEGEIITAFPEFHPIHTHLHFSCDLTQEILLHVDAYKPFTADLKIDLKKPLENGPILVAGQWEHLLYPLGKGSNIGSNRGSISIHGTLEHYLIDLNTAIVGLYIPAGNWHIQGDGDLTHIQLHSIRGKTLKGTVNGRLDMSWLSHLQWKTFLTASHLNPGIKWANWIGDINFHLQSTGNLSEKNKQFDLSISPLTGTLHEHVLSGNIFIQFQNNQLNLSNSYLSLGDDYLKIRGYIKNQWNLAWELKTPNFTEIIPSALGAITSQGSITGLRKTPLIKANLNISNFVLSDISIKSLIGTMNFDFTPGKKCTLELKTENAKIKHYLINSSDLFLSGLLKNHHVTFNIQTKKANIHGDIAGRYIDNKLNWQLRNFDLLSKAWSNWHLKNHASIEITSHSMTIQNFRWESNNAFIHGDLAWDKFSTWHAQLNIQHLPIDMMSSALPFESTIKALVDANINLNSDQERNLSGTFNLDTQEGDLSINDKKPVTLPSLHLNGTFDSKGLTIVGNILQSQKKLVNLTLQFPDYFGNEFPIATQPISGKITIDMTQLDLLPYFIPQVTNTAGTLIGVFDITGFLYAPIFDGKMTLKNARTFIAPIGLFLKDIDFELRGKKDGLLSVEGSLTSDNQKIHISGTTQLNQRNYASTFHIKGKDFPIYNTKEYQFYVSPNLTIAYNKPNLKLTGSIEIPKAQMTPKSFSNVVTLPSNTIVITGEEEQNKESNFEIFTDINILLGKEINLNYSGLTATIGGQLKINSAPNELTTGIGELNVTKGAYQIFGQTLAITKGNLIYTGGPINDPGINIQATKSIKQYMGGTATQVGSDITGSLSSATMVGINITGTLKKPVISLFSIPAGLSDSDILSYLLLGYSSNQASGAQAQLLIQAAQSTGAASNITNDIKQKFGLSDIGVESTTILDTRDNQTKHNTSFMLGKYITPRLYMSYSVGLLVPINVLTLRYAITHRFALQTETTSQENGADVFYTIQTD